MVFIVGREHLMDRQKFNDLIFLIRNMKIPHVFFYFTSLQYLLSLDFIGFLLIFLLITSFAYQYSNYISYTRRDINFPKANIISLEKGVFFLDTEEKKEIKESVLDYDSVKNQNESFIPSLHGRKYKKWSLFRMFINKNGEFILLAMSLGCILFLFTDGFLSMSLVGLISTVSIIVCMIIFNLVFKTISFVSKTDSMRILENKHDLVGLVSDDFN